MLPDKTKKLRMLRTLLSQLPSEGNPVNLCHFRRTLRACRAGARTPSPTLTTVSYKRGNVAPTIIAVPVTVAISFAGLLCSSFRRRRIHK